MDFPTASFEMCLVCSVGGSGRQPWAVSGSWINAIVSLVRLSQGAGICHQRDSRSDQVQYQTKPIIRWCQPVESRQRRV